MATVKDPVCGMMIDSDSAAARIERDSETFYFCSSACAVSFEADPELYAPRTATTDEADAEELEKHEPPYTTLGFLTSPKFGAAGSGGLEYERLPEAHPDRPA